MSFFNDDSSSGKRLDVSAAAMKAAAKSLEGFVPDNDPVRLPADILPRRGLVVVSGQFGSGKTKVLRHLVETHLTKNPSAKVIEVADITPAAANLITRGYPHAAQVISGEHVASIAEGVRRSMTANPDMIIMWEMRDKDSIRAALHAAMSGHLVLASAHAESASDLFRRAYALLASDREAMIDLAHVLRLVIHQDLQHMRDGFMVGRQFLRIDDSVLAALRNAQVETWAEILDRSIFGDRGAEDFGSMMPFQRYGHDSNGHRRVVLERFFTPDQMPVRKRAARAAVKTALRLDNSAPMRLSTPAGAEPLPEGMVLLMGAEGSGKSEMLLALASQAVRTGRRAFLLDREDFVASAQSRSAVKSAIMGFGLWRDADLLLHPVPFLKSAHPKHLLDLCAECHPGDFLGINLDLLPFDSEDLLSVVRALARNGRHVVLSSQISTLRISPESLDGIQSVLMMRQVNAGPWMDRIVKAAGLDAVPDPRTLQSLRPGEGFLAHAGTLTPFKADMVRPGTFGLSPAAEAAAARLEAALGTHPCATHTERLEMVARSFGFRSWHAAQGRKT